MVTSRRAFDNAYEADCLPSGAFVVAYVDGRIETMQRTWPAPVPLRFVRLTDIGGFKFAGQGQPDGSPVWEWVEADQQWYDRGPSNGTSPLIYDAGGALQIIRPGPDVTSQGYRYLAPDGRLVMGDDTYRDDTRLLNEFTETGPFTVGQDRETGARVLFEGRRLELEPGDTRFIRASYDGMLLATALRRLDTNQAVLAWHDVEGVRALPVAMGAPPIVVPPVVIPPVNPPTGGPVSSETKDWSGVTVINSSQAIAGNRMTGHVSRVEIGPHGFRFWFDKQTVWPNIYPVGGGPDVGKNDPVVFTTFVFIDLGGGRIYAIAMAMDAHNQPGEGASGPPLANWDADIFYPIGDAGQFRGRWQSAKRVGFGAAAGPERLQYAGHDWPNEVNEITDVAWVPAQEGAWDLPGGVVVTPPPPPTDPVETPPPMVNYDARFAYIEHRVQDLLNVLDDPDSGIRRQLADINGKLGQGTGGVSEQRVIDLINDRAVLRGATVTVQGSGKAPTFGGTVNVTSKGTL